MRTTVFFIISCLLAAVVPLWSKTVHNAEQANFPGFPAQFAGRPLQSLLLSQGELRYENEFPGRIGKFSDGQREVAMRWITEPTRLLHPAADCLKGSGYSLRPLPLFVDEENHHWGCLEGTRAVDGQAQTIRIRERIYDGAGNEWTDVSSWYWAALLGKSRGPWWAITVAENMPAVDR